MDTMRILLGATVALLLAAAVVSWTGMKKGVKNAPPDELAQLREQIAELKEELKEEIKAGREQAAAPVVQSAASPEEIAAVKAQLAETRAALSQLAEKDQAKLDKQLKMDEEGLLAQRNLEKSDAELRRARLITQALLIGRVKETVKDEQYGDFIIIDPVMPEQVQVGAILGIRRKTGILGQYQVTEVTSEGAIANPLPAYGPVDPRIGDELIFPPR